MGRRRALAVVYIVTPGALAAIGVVSDRFALYVAGLVLGLPLSLVGNVLAFMASATANKNPTAAGAAATAVAAAFIAIAFSGGAAIQTVVVQALLNRRRRDRHQG